MNTFANYLAAFRFRFSTAGMISTIAVVLCVGTGMFAPAARAATGDTDDQAMVDCMLPGRIMRLNNNAMIMGARHPIRTTREDCHVRGGEFHDADRNVDAERAAEAARISEADRVAEANRIAWANRAARAHHIAKTHRTPRKTVKSTSTK